MGKQIPKLILGGFIFALMVVLLVPYFISNFSTLKQQNEIEKRNQEVLQAQLAQEKAQKEKEKKMYLMGKFDPAERADFVIIPSQHVVGEEGKGQIYLRKEVLDAFLEMRYVAELENVDLKIVSATRNFDYQKMLWNNKWIGVTLVDGKNLSESIPNGMKRFRKILEYSAVPGISRHHWGTEVDINGVNPPYFNSEKGKKEYAWLAQHAGRFGFCQTYNVKDASRTTGYDEEKWHWSYLPLARNFTEEYKNLIKEEDISGFLGEEYVLGSNLINDYVLGINPNCL